jgi:energy-coupling factor transport system permease protein
MSLAAAPIARADAPLARRNPVAKLLAGLLFTSALLSTLDPLTPTLAIAVELAVLPWFGIGYRALLRRTGPILVSAIGLVVALLLFAGERPGRVLVVLGPIAVTTGMATNVLGLALRLLAVSLPGVLVFATTDPTDLADALVQHVRVPARFAIGALAAFRLLPLLGAQWRLLGLARRARGIDAGHNPSTWLALFGSRLFGLLVGAIRQGTRLAVAMDARGFDSGLPRTSARRQRFGPADWLLVLGGAATGTACLAVSLATGTFRPLLG